MTTMNADTFKGLGQRKGYRPIPHLAVFFLLSWCLPAHGGAYTDSAHGSGSYGVDRQATHTLGYSVGNCAHCHEQHAHIQGSEPTPAGGPGAYLAFDMTYTDQATGFCADCHTGLSSHQTAFARTNYSYSYWAGGAGSLTCPASILDAFSFIDEGGNPRLNCSSTSGSSHKLTDIRNFIDGRWGYNSESNPCCACHDPHRAKRDPHNAAQRGWPVSRPNGHANTHTWELWGDEAGEKMSDYTASYQAPYRSGSTTTFEPDGSTTQDGSNLTDYVTFCTDCHNVANTIYSAVLGRNLRPIDWANEKHGRGSADGYIKIDGPYSSVLGKVLACTDCHEPHGSPNVTLIRGEVNGAQLSTTIPSITSTDCSPRYSDIQDEMKALCSRCHNDDFEMIHHSLSSNDAAYNASSCSNCHEGSGGKQPINCNCCHFHGSSRSDCDYVPTTRLTF